MDARVLGDVLARERRSDRSALRVASEARTYSYDRLLTTAYRAGNFLRYLGVGRGHLVEVAPDPRTEPVLSFLGAALLGAPVRFAPVGDGEARAVVVHRDRETSFDLPPGSKLAVYGGPPEGPAVAHWERVVSSENPAFPPTDVSPTDEALRSGGDRYSHADLLAAASRVVEAYGPSEGSTVAVRASLRDPGVVAAGVLAPLLVGGEIVFPDEETVCDLGVGADVPEPHRVVPGDVFR
ncbi:MAG: acetyl-CoA synthetase [Salinigranum sp.]